jgi:hypothetical protein
MYTPEAAAPSGRPIDRRAVVRAGAWTVPAVSLAVGAPAYAASVNKGHLSFDTFNVFGADYNKRGKPTSAQSQIQVQNVYTAGGPTLTSIAVVVTYLGSRVTGASPVGLTGSGWTFGSATASGNSWAYSFVWTGSLASSHSTSTLSYKVPLKNASSGSISLAAVASATNVSSATAAATANL